MHATFYLNFCSHPVFIPISVSLTLSFLCRFLSTYFLLPYFLLSLFLSSIIALFSLSYIYQFINFTTSLCPFIYLCMCQSIYVFMHLSFFPSIDPFINLFISISTDLNKDGILEWKDFEMAREVGFSLCISTPCVTVQVYIRRLKGQQLVKYS